tara:strand:- start:117 stop:374 length:258 start_codon:yes stop_codon:yes gene_type:complete
MTTPFKLKYKNSAFPFKENGNPKSEASGYNPDEGYFQALLKATQENPEPKSYSKEDREIHQKSLYNRARQIQILDYRKKSLTLKK